MKVPLAEQLRPNTLGEVVGQPELLGPEGFITRTVRAQKPLSIILWGPPGSGKTSMARLYAKAFGLRLFALSAIFSGVADLRKIVAETKNEPLLARGALVFVDEIHRFNKTQQEAFLPFVEDGTLILVGATAENPSFHLSNALLSRVRVLAVKQLDDDALGQLLTRYDEKVGKVKFTDEARQYIIHLAQGDGRILFNMIESLDGSELMTLEKLKESLDRKPALYDRLGEMHYNLISALHKSVRGSDPDAALYWLCRMLEGGEDPLFILRRLIRAASEDIGLADPQALAIAIAARDTYEMLGSPEGELAVAQLTVYLALAPKSNAIYTAFGEAKALAAETTQLFPPKIIMNAPTKLMKEEGYGKGYIYDHDAPDAFSGQNYFPDGIDRHDFYHPIARGFERDMQKRLEYFNRLREQRKA